MSLLSLVPPPFPPNSLYAGHYCEENIYHLADSFLRQPSIKDVWDIAVVFMSNESKAVRSPALCVAIRHRLVSTYSPTQVALWYQNLAGSADHAIVWDYHVVLILRLKSDVGGETTSCTVVPEGDIQAWVYDYDTLLPKPCPCKGASPMSDAFISAPQKRNVFCLQITSR
jgi:protein N-terminal glutamine amidohydrolase